MPPTPPFPDPAAFDSALLSARLKALLALDRLLDTAQNPRQLHAAAVAILRLKPAADPSPPAPPLNPAPPEPRSAPANSPAPSTPRPPHRPGDPPPFPTPSPGPLRSDHRLSRRPAPRLLLASAGVAPSRPSPAAPPAPS